MVTFNAPHASNSSTLPCLDTGFGQRVFLSVEATPNFRTSLYVILGREFLYMLLSLYSTILLLLVT